VAHVARRVADAMLGAQPGRLGERHGERFFQLAEVAALRRAREG
jgi:hypothetical protein